MAGFFAEEFLSDVLARADIVDVIGEYVQLRRKGQTWWGLCPFHGEKTPSFHVDQAKQFYYCFGCHAGGNAFQFLQNIEKCDFSEAVEILTKRAGLQMPERKNEEGSREREELRTSLYELGRSAGRFFHDKLYSRDGLKALEYLQGRGLTERIIKRFGLGYAPDGHDEAMRFLEAQGYSREHLKAFGLVGEKEGRWFDYFRNRVMFPIIDRRGRVIGFGGRVMDGSQPKYLNSPETPVFNKRQNLFGLNIAQTVRGLERLIIVEGYMDVISMHQAGVPYTVASLGTALTEEQARLMRRFASEVFVAYDGDSAGQKATVRSLDILKDAGLNVKVVTIPDDMDPDDYARKFGLTGVEELLDRALPMIDFKLRTIAAQCDLATEDGRKRYLSQSCRDVLSKIASPVELDIYVKRLSRESGVSEMAIYEESGIERSAQKAAEYSAKNSRYTNAVMESPSRMQESGPMEGKRDNALRDAESYLLLLALANADFAAELRGKMSADSVGSERRQIASQILEGGAKPGAADLMLRLPGPAQAELARMQTLQLPEEREDRERLFADCLKTLEARALAKRIDELRGELGQPGLTDEDKSVRKKELTELLKKLSDSKNKR